MAAKVVHLKRPFNPAAPHIKVTYCGQNCGSVQFTIHDTDATCKHCIRSRFGDGSKQYPNRVHRVLN